MPVFGLVSGLIEETAVRAYVGDVLPYANPIRFAYDGLGTMQSSIFQIFAIVGAAILFAGEYRWETWRAILPRNDRTAVMFAKLLVFALAIAASILACGIGRWLVGLYDAMLTGQSDCAGERIARAARPDSARPSCRSWSPAHWSCSLRWSRAR